MKLAVQSMPCISSRTAWSTCASQSFSPVMFVTPLPFCTNWSSGVACRNPRTRTTSLMK